jgi:hypothetical protein
MPLPGIPRRDLECSWTAIVEFYSGLEATNPDFRELTRLADRLAASPYPGAGLYALTSMHTLILGPSTRVLDNPHLLVAYNPSQRQFSLEYRDGSAHPWKQTASPSEVYQLVERFLLKRARWFRATPTLSSAPQGNRDPDCD